MLVIILTIVNTIITILYLSLCINSDRKMIKLCYKFGDTVTTRWVSKQTVAGQLTNMLANLEYARASNHNSYPN